jgi:Zn-dependent metalloprotease
MNNPPQDGQSIDNAANFTSSMDVHYSSGVYNKAFYLLATKAGWNGQKAFKVFARANALYWTAEQHLQQRRLRRADGGSPTSASPWLT